MKKHIPNTLTCCNLISGCIATGLAFCGDYSSALLFIVIGAVFDFFDGFAARLLGVSSPIGKELDSLADDITFGFAPATIVFSILGKLLPAGTACSAGCHLACVGQALLPYLPYAAFLIAAFSALRLAKFNLDERQQTGFIGLPTPANALFWGALAQTLPTDAPNALLFWSLLGGALISCWLLVAEIPMFALKFKHFGWHGNALRYSFALASIALLCVLGLAGFSAVIVLYIVCSLVNNAVAKAGKQ